MAMVSLTKIRTMNCSMPELLGGLGVVPDDDDGHEEVIKTATIACRILLLCQGRAIARGPCRGVYA